MKSRKTDWRTFKDERRVMDYQNPQSATETSGCFGGNVGAMAAAMLASAGSTLCNFAGRVACETDYLAISGATFPTDVTHEEMERFNRRTMKADMSEADERARYERIADFFHGRARA